jgi:hypothetical protein
MSIVKLDCDWTRAHASSARVDWFASVKKIRTSRSDPHSHGPPGECQAVSWHSPFSSQSGRYRPVSRFALKNFIT